MLNAEWSPRRATALHLHRHSHAYTIHHATGERKKSVSTTEAGAFLGGGGVTPPVTGLALTAPSPAFQIKVILKVNEPLGYKFSDL